MFASNLAVGLINQAKRLLMECGFDEDAALKALKPLTVTNMNNIFDVGTCDALTGPVERHDIKNSTETSECLGSGDKGNL